jgi:hypothetical protein
VEEAALNTAVEEAQEEEKVHETSALTSEVRVLEACRSLVSQWVARANQTLHRPRIPNSLVTCAAIFSTSHGRRRGRGAPCDFVTVGMFDDGWFTSSELMLARMTGI